MNKIILKGRLTAHPELKTTNSGVSVCSFDIAVNRRFDREKSDFIRIETWRKTAEFVSKYFTKGQEILLEGELHIDKWEKDGEIKYLTKVVADNLEFCGSKNSIDDNTNVSKITETEPVTDIEEIIDEDLPF